MPQDSVTPNHMFGFRGTHCASQNYNRARYKKWPWISFLVATVCIGIIFFIAGSPSNIHLMRGKALVLCSILLFLGALLLIPSSIVVFYLGVYFLMVYFKCSSRKCCARPIEWAKQKNAEDPDDQFLMTSVRDENDNPTSSSSRNKKKQDQSSGSRNNPRQLSVPAIIVDAENANHIPHDRENKTTAQVVQPNAQQSVYSVQTDIHNTSPNAHRPREIHEQNYNHVHHNHYGPGHQTRNGGSISHDDSLPRRGRPDGITAGGDSMGFDNASYESEDDFDYSPKHQSYGPSSVHSYNHSAGSYKGSNRSMNRPYEKHKTPQPAHGVTRSPNLDKGPRTANNLTKSKNPPSHPNPPIDAHVNIVNHPVEKVVPNSSSRSVRSGKASNRDKRSRNKAQDTNAIEMDEVSIPQRRTLAEQAKAASKRPPPQVRGYQSSRKVSGYLETSMSEARAESSISGKSENFNAHNNNYRKSRASRPV